MISGKKTLALMICLLLAVSILPRAATAAPGDYFWDFNDMTNGAQPDGFTTAVLDTATYTPSISWLFPGNVGAAVSHLIGDPCAVMGSWFTNTSIQANRWLITPQVVVPEDGVLQWKGQSVDPNFLDSYNVLISTGGNDPSEFTTLLSITNEPGGNVYRTYTTHTVDLSGYAGQPVYIAFQLVSLSKFCLFLDDIRIFAAHIITASAGTGGGISPAGESAVVVGGTETYTITPSAGYRIASVLVDGAEQGNVSSYTFTDVQASHTISASFAAVDSATGPDYVARGLSDTSSGVSVSGSSIHRSASLRVRPLAMDTLPAALRDALSNGNLLLGYDISVSRGFRGSVKVSFPVGMAYEGQMVTILHDVNGSIETYTAVVTGGIATVTVDSFSPFAVLSAGIAAPAYVVTDPPKTGDAGQAAGPALVMAALLGAAALIRRKARL